ncbi:MAG TPA: HNH endonuclease [Asanoa sp.]
MADPANQGRRGRPWRRLREMVFARDGDRCHVCGHHGAREIDHLIRRADGGPPMDPNNLAPAHGTRSPCYLCEPGRGRCCNQTRNGRRRAVRAAVRRAGHTSREW